MLVMFPCGVRFHLGWVRFCVSVLVVAVFIFFFDNRDWVMWNSPVGISFLWDLFFFSENICDSVGNCFRLLRWLIGKTRL